MMKQKNGNASKFRIGANIRKWRNLKEMKQKDLASALQLSEAAVSNIENDITNLTLNQLEDISVALNVPIEQLLCDPQERYGVSNAQPVAAMQQSEVAVQDQELVTAVIESLRKKDEQLQALMQQLVHTIKELLPPQKSIFNSKQVSTRA